MGATKAQVSYVDQAAVLEPLSEAPALQSDLCLEPHYLFYRFICGQNESGEDAAAGNAGDDVAAGALPAQYSWTIWRPQTWPTLPPGLSRIRLRRRFLFRWAISRLHLFGGPDCGALLIYEGGRLAHYSGFTPRYWRFPFIASGDLQIGDTWTDPADRGRGLALFALQTIVAAVARPGRRLWYVVEVANKPSIRVAEKAHFTLAAEGTRVIPWGIKLAGAYVICRNCPSGNN